MKAGKKTAYVAALLLFLVFTVGPFVWAFVLSVTPEYAMAQKSEKLIPDTVTLENYQTLLSAQTQKGAVFLTGIKNSLKALSVTLPAGIVISTLTAYGLSRLEFPGRRMIRNILLITMAIPVMATMIPLFRMFVAGKWLNNVFWLSMVYVSSDLPMITWLMANYFSTIPKELEEAALMDGCGRMKAFVRIILPSCYPVLFSAALIIFLNTWGRFRIPLILASSLETKPVAIVVSEFMTKDSIKYGLTAAAGILAMIPPAFTALVFRRFLVSGMVNGSVKG